MIRKLYLSALFIVIIQGCSKEEPKERILSLNRAFIGSSELNIGEQNDNMPIDQGISLEFSSVPDQTTLSSSITLRDTDRENAVDISTSLINKNVTVYPDGVLKNNTSYSLTVSDQLRGENGEQFSQVSIAFITMIGDLKVESVLIRDQDVTHQNQVQNVPQDISIDITFTFPVDESAFGNALQIRGPEVPELDFIFSNDDKTVSIKGLSPLKYLSKYVLEIDNSLVGKGGEEFSGFEITLYSELDTTPKFPEISDAELLTKIQEYTFKYFWDFGHPVSGLSRERNTSGETVTSGGSGFGIMAIIVGIERGFISRSEGIERLTTLIGFLEIADRFHGAWPHWFNGTTGKVIPFSANDDGGDLVETSYAVMGMLTLRQYLNEADVFEAALIDKINMLVDGVEWDWYTQGENSLTWHWSPNFGFEKNLKIRGWNEALITYIMAAASQTHGISKEAYDDGWKNSNHFLNGKEFYGIRLPLGRDYGGPLFFEHYTYLGIDPRNLKDDQVDYWEQAVNHTLINRQHCIVNPGNYVGYSDQCWGLTASDGNDGYSAHSPTNDRGVITPTAAISSIPFTPDESMDAIRHFYYMLGDRTWGPYGFYDAFNITREWYTTSNIAIDQGPIIIMIENHRTGLFWELFMSCPEVQLALNTLDFTFQ